MGGLKEILQRRGRKQKHLIDVLGRDKSSISRYVRNPRSMTVDQLETVAEYLECRISDLLGETALDRANGAEGPNFRSRAAVKEELARIDLLSIRYLRELACADPAAPDGLKQLERYAAALRAELGAAV